MDERGNVAAGVDSVERNVRSEGDMVERIGEGLCGQRWRRVEDLDGELISINGHYDSLTKHIQD